MKLYQQMVSELELGRQTLLPVLGKLVDLLDDISQTLDGRFDSDEVLRLKGFLGDSRALVAALHAPPIGDR